MKAGDVRSAVVFDFAVLSSPGGREHNEDSTGIVVSPEVQGGFWVLADGLGGHKGGECASRVAVDAALESYRRDPRLDREALMAHVTRANEAVIERQRSEPELLSMRTTIVALIASGEAALWAHAGDSRLYHFRGGEIVAQTRDHSVPQRLADAGEITADAIRFHEDRNRLLRSLGSKADPGATVVGEPVPIAPGDAFLLASDGLWEWVTESEMVEELGRASSAESWLGAIEARLKLRATEGNDNYSGIAVIVGAGPLAGVGSRGAFDAALQPTRRAGSPPQPTGLPPNDSLTTSVKDLLQGSSVQDGLQGSSVKGSQAFSGKHGNPGGGGTPQ